MIRKRILSLLVCAALLCGVLAGCSTSSGSTAASSSSASASESIPSSTVTADTGKVGLLTQARTPCSPSLTRTMPLPPASAGAPACPAAR